MAFCPDLPQDMANLIVEFTSVSWKTRNETRDPCFAVDKKSQTMLRCLRNPLRDRGRGMHQRSSLRRRKRNPYAYINVDLEDDMSYTFTFHVRFIHEVQPIRGATHLATLELPGKESSVCSLTTGCFMQNDSDFLYCTVCVENTTKSHQKTRKIHIKSLQHYFGRILFKTIRFFVFFVGFWLGLRECIFQNFLRISNNCSILCF